MKYNKYKEKINIGKIGCLNKILDVDKFEKTFVFSKSKYFSINVFSEVFNKYINLKNYGLL